MSMAGWRWDDLGANGNMESGLTGVSECAGLIGIRLGRIDGVGVLSGCEGECGL